MFDFDNYGDLLFPLVAERRLARYGYRTIPVAPSAGRPSFADALAPIDMAQMMQGDEPIAGILVGGGYLIHASSLDFMEHYKTDGAGAWSGLGLWLGAAAARGLQQNHQTDQRKDRYGGGQVLQRPIFARSGAYVPYSRRPHGIVLPVCAGF